MTMAAPRALPNFPDPAAGNYTAAHEDVLKASREFPQSLMRRSVACCGGLLIDE
jgi:hypothetical protein